MPRTHHDDRDLLTRIAAKDRRAFEALYHRYYRRLFGYLLKLTRRADLVEEILNDVMLIVWQSADRYQHGAKPSSWIFGIAFRRSLKTLKKAARHKVADPEARKEPIDPQQPEGLAVRREESATLSQALLTLSLEQRAVVELTYFHGFTYPEIAKTLRCPVNTVKTRMFHARRKLRELLPEMGIEPHHVGEGS